MDYRQHGWQPSIVVTISILSWAHKRQVTATPGALQQMFGKNLQVKIKGLPEQD